MENKRRREIYPVFPLLLIFSKRTYTRWWLIRGKNRANPTTAGNGVESVFVPRLPGLSFIQVHNGKGYREEEEKKFKTFPIQSNKITLHTSLYKRSNNITYRASASFCLLVASTETLEAVPETESVRERLPSCALLRQARRTGTLRAARGEIEPPTTQQQ